MLHFLHKFVSPKADGPDSTQVRPSDWNDEHELKTTTVNGMVLGRDTSGSGDIQELPIHITPGGDRLQIPGTGGFTPPAGTSVQRPAPPNPGEMRFNTQTLALEIYGLNGAAAWTPITANAFATPGDVKFFAGTVDKIPAGWLRCDGSAVNRATYAALFDVIGITYGAGDGSTTFNLPDLRDTVAVGVGDTFTLAHRQGGYTNTVSLTTNNLPAHKHNVHLPFTSLGNAGTVASPGNAVSAVVGQYLDLPSDDNPTTHDDVVYSPFQPSLGIFALIKF